MQTLCIQHKAACLRLQFSLYEDHTCKPVLMCYDKCNKMAEICLTPVRMAGYRNCSRETFTSFSFSSFIDCYCRAMLDSCTLVFASARSGVPLRYQHEECHGSWGLSLKGPVCHCQYFFFLQIPFVLSI